MTRRRERILRYRTPAMFCNHANEVPMWCPCNEDCYCRDHTCRSRPFERHEREGVEPSQDEASWRAVWRGAR